MSVHRTNLKSTVLKTTNLKSHVCTINLKSHVHRTNLKSNNKFLMEDDFDCANFVSTNCPPTLA